MFNASLFEFFANPAFYQNASYRLPLIDNSKSMIHGTDRQDFSNEKNVQKAVENLDRRFDLVMLTDHIDEFWFCCVNWCAGIIWSPWSLTRENLTDYVRQKIERYTPADVALYEYFRKRFAEKVDKYGSARMQRDVTHLRNLFQRWRTFCMDQSQQPDELDEKLGRMAWNTLSEEGSNNDFVSGLGRTGSHRFRAFCLVCNETTLLHNFVSDFHGTFVCSRIL